MNVAQMIALNWRAITAFAMACVQLCTALGWLPIGSEETANTLIGSAGLVIATIAGGSYVQNIATSRAITAQAGAVVATSQVVDRVAAASPSAALASVTSAARDAASELIDLAERQPR